MCVSLVVQYIPKKKEEKKTNDVYVQVNGNINL